MAQVEIEYCVPCGFLPAAEESAHALLSALDKRVARLSLIPSHGGVFRIRVDGETVFDKARADRYDIDEIVNQVSTRLPDPAVIELQARE